MDDYSDDKGNNGLQIETQDYYDMICQLAYDNNFVVATHAIGDGGNRLMLDTYGKFLKGKNDRRWRIEHAQIINPDDLKSLPNFLWCLPFSQHTVQAICLGLKTALELNE